MSGLFCSAGNTVFFEAQPLGPDEHPDRARSVLMPRAASSAVRPRVVNGPDRQRSRSQSARSQDKVRGLRPPTWPGVSEPVSLVSFFHFDTQDGLIRKEAAIDRVVSPASNRAKARSRKSSE
jgi:hypothetical protein